MNTRGPPAEPGIFPKEITRGEELFNGKQLGKNGMSCADCHLDGKNLEDAAGYKEDKLAGIINQYIKNPLKGNSLAAD